MVWKQFWPRRRGGEAGQHDSAGVCSICGTRLRRKDDRCPGCHSLISLQRFLDAVGLGDEAQVKAQLEQEPRLVTATVAGGVKRTPLHRAAAAGQADIARLLLEHGAPVEARDIFGATPLHLAARHNAIAAAAVLLDHGADPNARKHDLTTPIDLAAEGGHHAMVALLRSRAQRHATATDEQPSDRANGLHAAADNNYQRQGIGMGATPARRRQAAIAEAAGAGC